MKCFFTIITALILSICSVRPSDASGVQPPNIQVVCPYGMIHFAVSAIKSQHRDLVHQIILGERLEVFKEAINRTPPPTDAEFDRLDVFSTPKNTQITTVIVSLAGCVLGHAIYYTEHFERFLNGEVGPFPEPNIKKQYAI